MLFLFSLSFFYIISIFFLSLLKISAFYKKYSDSKRRKKMDAIEKQNFVSEAIEKRIPILFNPKPGRQFFQKIGIGQIRWGQIMRKTGKQVNLYELRQISEHFNIPIEELTTKPM